MIKILSLNSSQAQELSQLAVEVFCKTFLPNNKAEAVHDYADKYLNTDILANTLSDPNYFTFGVFNEQVLIGYIQFFVNREESFGGSLLELKRFYLHQEHHGKGVAQEMMAFCFLKSKDLGFKKFWLGVWEKNDRAQNFYKKLGFKKVGTHMFNMGGEIQTDDILLKDLEL